MGAAYIASPLEGRPRVGVFQGVHFLRNLGSLGPIALAPAIGRSIMSCRAYRAVVVARGLFLLRHRG